MKEKLKDFITKKKRIWIPILIGAITVIVAVIVLLNSFKYTAAGLNYYAENNPKKLISLYTDYGDFTISNGKQTAVFEDGQKVSGDLPVYDTFIDYGFTSSGEDSLFLDDYFYKYYICPLLLGQEYIIQYEGERELDTGFGGSGYCYRIKSGKGGSVQLTSTWKMSANFSQSTDLLVRTNNDNYVGKKWYGFYVNGVSDGIEVQLTKREYRFASKNARAYNVEIYAHPEHYYFENVIVGENGVSFREKNKNVGVMYKGNKKAMTFDISESQAW